MQKLFILVAAIVAFVLFTTHPEKARAEVNINVGIIPPIPQVVISTPPPMIQIPGTYIYAVPDIDADVVFYQGSWFRPHQNYWYRSNGYNGPWVNIDLNFMPGPILRLPPGFRSVPPGHKRFPYGQMKKNWRSWEQSHHWGDYGHKRKHKNKHKRKHKRK